jgi:TRAP-type C4-dicarboxylate transport system substrate-binding protein
MKTLKLLAGALALSFGLAAGAGHAQTFRGSTYNGAQSPVGLAMADMAKEIDAATNGKVKFEMFYGGAVLPPDGHLKGTGTGVVQVGQITATYHQAEFPYTNVINDLSFVADDIFALAFAYTEAKIFNRQLLDELKDKNIVFGTAFTIGIYNYICAGAGYNKIEDFKGKKIRAASFPQVEFVKSIGAVPVSVVAPELYTGLQRGSVDCTGGSPEFLTAFFKLNEVAKSIYKIPLGSVANDGYYFHKSWWQQRSVDERRAMITKAFPRVTARMMMNINSVIDDAWKVSRDKGIAIVEPEAAAMARLKAFSDQYVADMPKIAKEKRNVEAEPLIKDFVARLNRWKTLLASVDKKNEAALIAVLEREIFGKIDVNTYGMN